MILNWNGTCSYKQSVILRFLGATKHLHNWLCPLVGWSVGQCIRSTIHTSHLIGLLGLVPPLTDSSNPTSQKTPLWFTAQRGRYCWIMVIMHSNSRRRNFGSLNKRTWRGCVESEDDDGRVNTRRLRRCSLQDDDWEYQWRKPWHAMDDRNKSW